MSTLQTIRLWLEPDRDLPRFRRLRWAFEEVSITDVLLRGIHPWTGSDAHYGIVDGLLQRLNAGDAKLPELAGMHYCPDIGVAHGTIGDARLRLEHAFRFIASTTCFVDRLGYRELLDAARDRLRAIWSHRIALSLVSKAYPGFQELRQFIKGRDRRVRLSGYGDLESLDLGRVLSLEDFGDQDELLIETAIPARTFRRASCLDKVSDESGRLRLREEIRDLTVTVAGLPREAGYAGTYLVYHVAREGTALTFYPDLGKSCLRRNVAELFAARWRTNRGRLVFQTTLEHLEAMLAEGAVEPAFPSLHYRYPGAAGTARVEVVPQGVAAFHVGPYCTRHSTGEHLRQVLRDHGRPMTGSKNRLLEKLAALAAERYAEAAPGLAEHFAVNRCVHVGHSVPGSRAFHLPGDQGPLGNLVLAMYLLRHLRGGAVLDPAHENTTHTPEQLARALLAGHVTLAGAFLPAG